MEGKVDACMIFEGETQPMILVCSSMIHISSVQVPSSMLV